MASGFKPNRAFARKLLMSDGAQAIVHAEAERVCADANGMAGEDLFAVRDGSTSETRRRSFVHTKDRKAVYKQAKHGYLERSV